MLPEFRAGWTRFRRVPKQYLGGDLNGGKKISIFGLAVDPESRWAAPNEDYKEIFFWDPDMMNRWVKYMYGEILAGRADLGYPTVTERTQYGYGLRIDLSSLPTPRGPIWLHDTDRDDSVMEYKDAGMGRMSPDDLKAWQQASNDTEERMNKALGSERVEDENGDPDSQ